MVTGGGTGEGPRPRSARELQAVIHAERVGEPFFVYRGPGGDQRIVHFEAGRPKLTIGRNSAADLSLEWDDQVSALHAVIERHAGELTLLDDGLSRNGSFVNEQPVHGDEKAPGRGRGAVRAHGGAGPPPRRFAPELDLERAASGAGRRNQDIANALHLSVAAVKLHLRALFEKFDVSQNASTPG